MSTYFKSMPLWVTSRPSSLFKPLTTLAIHPDLRHPVVPAAAGTQRGLGSQLDSRSRGNDARESAEGLAKIRGLL